jgi:hypothetical protein
LIFERTGRAAKTHRGVHGQFLRLVANEPGIDFELRRFLSHRCRHADHWHRDSDGLSDNRAMRMVEKPEKKHGGSAPVTDY